MRLLLEGGEQLRGTSADEMGFFVFGFVMGDGLDHRRFSGAVRTDDGDEVAATDV